MFGRDKNAARKKRGEEERARLLSGDHPTKRHYKKIVGSKKKGCTAGIDVKQVTRFIDYKDCNSKWSKRKASEEIRLARLRGETLASERRFYIRLPSNEDHQKTHSVGELTGFLNPLNSELRKKIHELVTHGVTTVKEMKRHLRIHVETVLFPSPQSRPPCTNLAYYPTEKCLRNHIYASIVKLSYATNVD
ncbi:calcium-responsive transcription factor-like [Strongylocentrotus purpuratus]|uniref:Uncharacterized protein n=1 Tax=Strongylocentrotus purpuratus TaxID=7668 RepID=A0A7M7NG64_STRPU|nr:calcium-responsive transcription factor-like [Strongylocentrotus purpuratus]